MRVSRIKAPSVTPRPLNREAIKKQESGSEAKPDSEQVTLNRHPVTQNPRTRPAGRLVRVVTPVPGCRVSLLVSMGVMGFLGDLGGEIEIFP